MPQRCAAQQAMAGAGGGGFVWMSGKMVPTWSMERQEQAACFRDAQDNSDTEGFRGTWSS